MSTATVVEIRMPRLSDSMEEGIIAAWLVASGDEVREGQEIVEIETDKATMVYETEASGPITIVAAEGDTVAVGDVIAVLGDGAAEFGAAEFGEAPEPPSATSLDERGEAAGTEDHAASPATSAPADTAARASGRANASPVARRMAAELGVDLSLLNGSGPRGRIVKTDVRRAHEARSAPDPRRTGREDPRGEITRVEPSRLQRLIASRMVQAKTDAPEFVLDVDVDMSAAVVLREQIREALPDGRPPSFNDFVIKASALALRAHPHANGAWRDDAFEHYDRVNVGMAVAAPGALVVPTIFDADRRSVRDIAKETRQLAEKVRAGKIAPHELEGGTFSVSNLGMYGIDAFMAVLNPPQAAILAVGALKQRPVVIDDAIVARPTLTLTLTCDHRILYGADAAQFLAHIRHLLEHPSGLLL